MTRVKICGITRQEDAVLAAQLGADFLGFVFVKESPRCVSPEVVQEIDAPAKRVGVFRNESIEEMLRIAAIARLDLIQLHGSETEEVVEAITLPVIRAYKVESTLPKVRTSAAYVMFDTGGGTGRAFDWSLLNSSVRAHPFFLAGGITPENAMDAVRTEPFAIDLSSGVEHAAGIKDPDKLKRLFEKVKP